MPLFLIILIFFKEQSFPDIFSRKDWSFYFERGVIQFNASMYNDAKDSFHKVLELKPDSFEAMNYLAEIYIIHKNKIAAMEFFQKSLSINNKQIGIHIKLGEMLEYFGKTAEAFTHYEEAYMLDKNSTLAMINYSRMLRFKGDKASADEILSQCKALNIEKSHELKAKADSLRKTNPEAAEKLYREAIQTNPADFDLYFYLASFYRGESNPQKAAELIEELKKIKNDYARAYFYLGNLYYDSKFPQNTRKYYIHLAIKNLEEGLKLEDNSEAMLHLSRIHKELKNNDKASELEQKAFELIKQGK